MKRIVFSQYTSKVDPHVSASEYKKTQLAEYKDILIEKQKQYALLCDADYECFNVDFTDYNDIQFSKLLRFEELTKHYDEVLYLDLDVFPQTSERFFVKFDLNWISAYSIISKFDPQVFKWRNQDNNWHSMDMFSKTCAKNSMLLLDDISGSDACINTGVLGMNKQSVDDLMLSERLQHSKNLFEQAKVDNLYPAEVSANWEINNEVIFTYLLERYNLHFADIGMAWNFIVDHNVKTASPAAHMLHVVNKEFNNYLS